MRYKLLFYFIFVLNFGCQENPKKEAQEQKQDNIVKTIPYIKKNINLKPIHKRDSILLNVFYNSYSYIYMPRRKENVTKITYVKNIDFLSFSFANEQIPIDVLDKYKKSKADYYKIYYHNNDIIKIIYINRYYSISFTVLDLGVNVLLYPELNSILEKEYVKQAEGFIFINKGINIFFFGGISPIYESKMPISVIMALDSKLRCISSIYLDLAYTGQIHYANYYTYSTNGVACTTWVCRSNEKIIRENSQLNSVMQIFQKEKIPFRGCKFMEAYKKDLNDLLKTNQIILPLWLKENRHSIHFNYININPFKNQ